MVGVVGGGNWQEREEWGIAFTGERATGYVMHCVMESFEIVDPASFLIALTLGANVSFVQ